MQPKQLRHDQIFEEEQMAVKTMKGAKSMETCDCCDIECPWTGEGRGVDLGCLPSPADMVARALYHNELMSCHRNLKKPCVGIVKELKRQNVDFTKLNLVENT